MNISKGRRYIGRRDKSQLFNARKALNNAGVLGWHMAALLGAPPLYNREVRTLSAPLADGLSPPLAVFVRIHPISNPRGWRGRRWHAHLGLSARRCTGTRPHCHPRTASIFASHVLRYCHGFIIPKMKRFVRPCPLNHPSFCVVNFLH